MSISESLPDELYGIFGEGSRPTGETAPAAEEPFKNRL